MTPWPERDLIPPCENRWDRGMYDYETASHIIADNGTLIGSFDPVFMGAALRARFGIDVVHRVRRP